VRLAPAREATVRHRAFGIVVAALLVGALLAAPGAVFAETVIVQMTSVDFQPRFVPSDLTILPGDTVRWVNVDPSLIDHSTCSGTGSADPRMGELWNSGAVATGRLFEVTFDEIGEYEYFSVLHEFENMFGVIRVSDDSTPVREGIEDSTWARIKQRFDDILPRE
jgi:plastocyanin